MPEPHRCPVCEGRGKVPAGFYTPERVGGPAETCRSCGGTGVVTVEEGVVTPPAGDDPYDLTYRQEPG